MKVINIHRRTIPQPKEAIAALLPTLASKEDKMWPIDQWPRMRLDRGLTKGAKGGHGPIRYYVAEYEKGDSVQFNFLGPKGFDGYHKFEIKPLDQQKTEIKHIIDMETKGKGTWLWLFAIRWLHDALIEDAFDRIENQFSPQKKMRPWNLWVRFLRWALAARK